MNLYYILSYKNNKCNSTLIILHPYNCPHPITMAVSHDVICKPIHLSANWFIAVCLHNKHDYDTPMIYSFVIIAD